MIQDDPTFYPPDRKHVMTVRRQEQIVATSGKNLAWRKIFATLQITKFLPWYYTSAEIL
jgi:hypothetical protein